MTINRTSTDLLGLPTLAYTDNCIEWMSQSLPNYKEWKCQNDPARMDAEGLIGRIYISNRFSYPHFWVGNSVVWVPQYLFVNNVRQETHIHLAKIVWH